MERQHQRVARGFLNLPYFAVKTLEAAVQVVGAVVNSYGVGVPVNGKPAFGDAICDRPQIAPQ